MKTIVLQLTFIIGIFFFYGLIIFFLKKNALSLKYTLLWIFSGFFMLLVSIFPNSLRYVTNILGFELVSNAIFSFLLGFIIIILLQLTSIVSKQSESLKTLIQTNALLEKRIRELEEAK